MWFCLTDTVKPLISDHIRERSRTHHRREEIRSLYYSGCNQKTAVRTAHDRKMPLIREASRLEPFCCRQKVINRGLPLSSDRCLMPLFTELGSTPDTWSCDRYTKLDHKLGEPGEARLLRRAEPPVSHQDN